MPNDMAPNSNNTRPFFDIMSRRQRRPFCGNKNGVALILVLAALAIITVILVGFTLDMQLEKQASQSSLTSLKSDAAVQAALAHATALLAQNIPPVAHGSPTNPAATTFSLNNPAPVNWWVNPGLLSTQTGNGNPVQIPLYTTLSTTFSGAAYPPADTPPTATDTTDSATVPAKAVDLNRPTLRNSSVYTVTGSDTANANPMRVYWQYVVQDPSQPHNSATNPYVSRYAFWMEPENSRIDIGTAFGKDTTQGLPDAAGGTAAAPSYSLPTFNVNGTPTALPNGATLATSFTLGNPASVDLSVLKIPGATPFFNFFDTTKFFNTQQFIQRGNVAWGGLPPTPTPYNSLPLGGDVTTPATLDDTEQIKNFVKSGFTTQQGEQFYTDNQFYLTNYSRDPEFNVFGGARLYPNEYDGTINSWYRHYDLNPTYQYFWNTCEPTWFDGAGVTSDTMSHLGGGQGRTYLGILYLSQMMQKTTWPGYTGASMASKWNAANPTREADQVAWNIYGLATSMQDQYNWGSTGPPLVNDEYEVNNFGGYNSKNFLQHWASSNGYDAPGNNTRWTAPGPSTALGIYVTPSGGAGPYYLGYGLWSGTTAATRYSAEGNPLFVDEIGINARLVQAAPTLVSGAPTATQSYNLRFSFEYDLAVPTGFFVPGSGPTYFPLGISTGGATTLVVTYIQYTYQDAGGTPHTVTDYPGKLHNPDLADSTGQALNIPAYQFKDTTKTQPDATTGALLPILQPNTNVPINAGDRKDVLTSVTNDLDPVPPATTPISQTQEFTDTSNPILPAQFPGGITLTNVQVKFALLLNSNSQPLQVVPLTSPSTTATATVASLESASGSPSYPATITFGSITPPNPPPLLTGTSAPFQSFGKYDQGQLQVMKVDDARLAVNANAWRAVSAPGDFGVSPSTIHVGPAPTNSQLSKFALPPMSTGSNDYPFSQFNDFNFISPGMLFYACTGMQGAKPWQTLSLQPGGGTGSAMTATRGTAPPDYLLLDLLQSPYRYENMNSSQGKVNINSLIYPSYFNMKRLLPLEAVFANTKVAGTTIAPGAGNEAETIANDIQTEESTLNGFRYSGELCEVASLGQSGTTDFQKEGLMRNLSGLITTRSNSFGMWGAAEAIVEQPTGHVTVLSDKRFHAIVERYVWPGVDGFFGNAYANTGGSYPNSASTTPGDYLDTIDGPDNPNVAILRPNAKPAVPSIYTANTIPLNMNPPTGVSIFNGTTPKYTATPLEIANNPLCPYMRYRVVNFRYISD